MWKTKGLWVETFTFIDHSYSSLNNLLVQDMERNPDNEQNCSPARINFNRNRRGRANTSLDVEIVQMQFSCAWVKTLEMASAKSKTLSLTTGAANAVGDPLHNFDTWYVCLGFFLSCLLRSVLTAVT